MRYFVILSAALLAVAAWSGSSIGREKDSSNDSQSNASDSSTNDSQSTGQTNNDRSRQDRENSDDAQHHAALGISMAESDGHVRVIAVMPGSPAARAGLQVGDEIRAVGDQRIRTAEGLTEEIGEQQPGATVELSIRRNGERRTLQARLASSQEAGRWRNGRQFASNASYDDYNNNSGSYNNNYGNRQNGWNRNRASSYDPNSQSVNQQLNQLRQQVAQLQQEVDELRNQSANGNRAGYRNRSNNASRDGGQRNYDQDQE